jgi:hypothetical protein
MPLAIPGMFAQVRICLIKNDANMHHFRLGQKVAEYGGGRNFSRSEVRGS